MLLLSTSQHRACVHLFAEMHQRPPRWASVLTAYAQTFAKLLLAERFVAALRFAVKQHALQGKKVELLS